MRELKIVVTGALGHIGSRLIRVLPNQFNELQIVLIDNLATQRVASLFELPKKANYSFIEGDVTTTDLIPIFSDAHVVVHLAATTDATKSFNNAAEVERNNLISTQKVAEACVSTNSRMIHLSSTSVYGSQSQVVDENCPDRDLRPQSPYATTKLAEEKLVRHLSVNNGLRAVSCRFGTIFGVSPGMRFHTAVNKFCLQAAMGQPLTVWSTAYDQKRPYLDLGDACGVVSHLIENELFDGQIFNVVSENTTVRNIVDLIREVVPALTINIVEHEIMNQLSYEVDDTRIRATGYKSSGLLRQGIKDTLSLLSSTDGKSLAY